MTFHLVPVKFWDDPDGPRGHEVPGGHVYLYRQGAFQPELEGAAEVPLQIPSGNWVWIAEAPGYVSTFTNVLPVPEEPVLPRRELTVPVVPACRVQRSDDPRWNRLDRVDVVSLTESSVYPMTRGGRDEYWIPQGSYLAYGVANGELTGISPVGRCRANDSLNLPVPEPPAAGRESLLVTLSLPEETDPAAREEVVAELTQPGPLQSAAPISPTASFWQGIHGALFFLDAPADAARELTVRHPDLRSRREVVEPLGGSAREVDLGTLPPRRGIEVPVDYRPRREHRSARISIQRCGLERASVPPPALVERCDEPFDTQPLEPGVASYRFEGLDDGQYLVSAKIDDEEIPGLGQAVMPYLDPTSDRSPPPHPLVRLAELELHGELRRNDEPVPGWVELEPWTGAAGIPTERATTGDDLEYHLYYFGRQPERAEMAHFPEELEGKEPEEMPGLYCCFRMKACSSAGACRTFNIHSAITGGGEFDIELPGTERIDVAVVDADTREPIGRAHVQVEPSLAFHFYFGEVFWYRSPGLEPDTLIADENGHVSWLPPRPGEQHIEAWATGYQVARQTVGVPAGGEVQLTLALQADRSTEGTYLAFEDGVPAVGATLVAFDREGTRRAACDAAVNPEGYVEVHAGCERELTYLLVHPRAALQTFSAEEVAGSGSIEARRRPDFPPTIRLLDENSEPVADAFVELKLGDLEITPNDLFAGASGGLPFEPTTNPVGELVLQGVDVDTVERVEVSAWQPFEEHWVTLRSAQRGVVDVPAVPPG